MKKPESLAHIETDSEKIIIKTPNLNNDLDNISN